MQLKFHGVNDAFYRLVEGFHSGSLGAVKSTSRNGDVLTIPEPVTITYYYPRQRVLFNTARDANPFFHLYESLWMLAGRNDIAPLNYYLGGRYSAFSDDGVTANGAYGYRWRKAKTNPEGYQDKTTDERGVDWNETDQLSILIEHLRSTPNSRRAVLQMWNVEDDLLKIGTPIETTSDSNQTYKTFKPDPNYSKDVCCNLSVLFSVRKEYHEGISEAEKAYSPNPYKRYLDMTVFNRSNDLIWGALGANVVHFSMLQEYMANCLNVEVGVYNQVSNNLHVYTNNWKPEEWLKAENFGPNFYPNEGSVRRLVVNQDVFDKEVVAFVEKFSGTEGHNWEYHFREPFLDCVAKPMMYAFYFHKQRNYRESIDWLARVKQVDWQLAARTWILKRMDTYNKKEKSNAESTIS